MEPIQAGDPTVQEESATFMGHFLILHSCRDRPGVCKRRSVRKGVWVHPQIPIEEIRRVTEMLDRSHLGQLWIGDEGVSRDPFVVAADCLSRTSTLEVGIGVTNPILRHPGVVAAASATLAEFGQGRFILGWGTGGTESLQPFGLSATRPLLTIENAVRIADAVFCGTSFGDYHAPPHAVEPNEVRQYIGARGLHLNTLASRICDGVFLSGVSDDDLPHVVDAARSHRPIEIALFQTVARFGEKSPSVVSGSAREIAHHLDGLAEMYEPTSIGVACSDSNLGPEWVDFAGEILERIRS